MSEWARAILLTCAILAVLAIAYMNPTNCTPDTPSFRIGNMLVAGCR